MHLCIFNPEHDLCLAKGRAHYVPPRSAVEFARRDAGLMQVLYPDAVCCSVYDLEAPLLSPLKGGSSPPRIPHEGGKNGFNSIVAWGWDAVVKHELLKRGAREELLPTDAELATIRELQHRSTILPLQPDCHEVHTTEEMRELLREQEHWVMKAPWSGAGRGLRWVHGALTDIDRDWLEKTVATQRCVVAEPRREVVADVALEYGSPPSPPLVPPEGGRMAPLAPLLSPLKGGSSPPLIPPEGGRMEEGFSNFIGYSYFRTGSGVYKDNIMWSDDEIASHFAHTSLQATRAHVERWLEDNVWPRYRGPLGIDLMVCADGSVHVAEMNVRHTMGMVAHERVVRV